MCNLFALGTASSQVLKKDIISEESSTILKSLCHYNVDNVIQCRLQLQHGNSKHIQSSGLIVENSLQPPIQVIDNSNAVPPIYLNKS